MAEKTDLLLYDSDEDSSEDDDDTIDSSTPSPRFWHFSQLVEGGNVYIGGGNIPQYRKKKDRARLVKIIEEFSVKERKWRQRETKGDHHPGLTGVACASFGKYLFAYGGNNAEDLNGVLSQLDLDTFMWSRLSPETADGPMKKDASGMVHFGEDSLAVMCGYAIPRDRIKYHGGSSDRASRFIIREGPSAEGDGWTNEIHIFNHKFHPGTWVVPSFSGPRPPPCADFSLTSIDLDRAILYGGRRGTDENSNDLYLIDFNEKTIVKIQQKNKQEDKWPKMRLGHHAACCLGFNTKNPQLLISGGRIKHELPPKDIWILNLATQKWNQVELPIKDNFIRSHLARWGHTFTAITHSEGLVEIILFGGSPGFYEVTWDVYKGKEFRRLSFPVSFIFGFLNKEWVMLDIVDCDKHWSSKTAELMSFNRDSPIMLDVLYSMERDNYKIPILTELVTNKKIRSIISSKNMEARFKWPTLTEPSFLKPIWENLISILKLVKQNDLIKNMKQHLKKMKAPIARKRLLTAGDVEGRPRTKLQKQKKSQSTSDADGYTFEGAASHLSDISGNLAEELEATSESVQQPWVLPSQMEVRPQLEVRPQPLIIFSKDMSYEQLAVWLTNHPRFMGADYQQDISKLRDAKINGFVFLNLNENMLRQLGVPFGFQFILLDIIGHLKRSQQVRDSEGLPPQLESPSSTVASLASRHVPTSESATGQQNQTKLNKMPNLDELLLFKYTDKGEKKKIRIINEACHMWQDIATLICNDSNITRVLEQKWHGDPKECLKQTFIDNFINKKPQKYSQDWNGLIELLNDVELETLAENVRRALSYAA